MTRWEYDTTDPLSVDGMNLRGSFGWELIGAYPPVGRNPPAMLWKRPLPQGTAASARAETTGYAQVADAPRPARATGEWSDVWDDAKRAEMSERGFLAEPAEHEEKTQANQTTRADQ